MKLGNRGFSLFEVTLALMVLALGLPAICYLFTGVLTTNGHTSSEEIAQYLAASLLNEISERRFELNAANPGNTPTPGDINGFDRTGFQHIGDYNEFQTWGALNPPRDEHGNQLTAYPAFYQSANVVNVTGPSLNFATPMPFTPVSDGSTNFKIVSVTIGWNQQKNNITVSKLFALP